MLKFYDFTLAEYMELKEKEIAEAKEEAAEAKEEAAAAKEEAANAQNEIIYQLVSKELASGTGSRELLEKLMNWFDLTEAQAEVYLKD